jgi:hypothetical protein
MEYFDFFQEWMNSSSKDNEMRILPLFLKFINIFHNKEIQSKIDKYANKLPQNEETEFVDFPDDFYYEIRREFLRFFHKNKQSKKYENFSKLEEDFQKELNLVPSEYEKYLDTKTEYGKEKEKLFQCKKAISIIEDTFQYFLQDDTVGTTNYKPLEDMRNAFYYLKHYIKFRINVIAFDPPFDLGDPENSFEKLKDFVKVYFNVKTGVYSEKMHKKVIKDLKFELRRRAPQGLKKIKDKEISRRLYNINFHALHLELSLLFSKHESNKVDSFWEILTDAYIFAKDFIEVIEEKDIHHLLSLVTTSYFHYWPFPKTTNEICLQTNPEQILHYHLKNQEKSENFPEFDIIRNEITFSLKVEQFKSDLQAKSAFSTVKCDENLNPYSSFKLNFSERMESKELII